MASTSEPHNQNLSLQKYLLLQSQHETLREHLDQMLSTALSSASTTTSPAVSPTRDQKRRQRSSRRRSSVTPGRDGAGFGWSALETVVDETTLYEVAAEERRLFDVNEGIKRALTELLNCDAVRSDSSFRTWVQCRLMETEKELRSGRRRRSMAGM